MNETTNEEQTYDEWRHAENTAIEEEIYGRKLIVKKNGEIYERYANEPTMRRYYTPKQRRRIEKQRNKWRRRILGKS